MGIFQDDQPPELYIPANLDKPAGAAVADDGSVACVGCKKRIPLSAADIVGQGYRCAPCSQQAAIHGLASGRSDAAAHLDSRERAEVRRHARQLMWTGGACMAGGVVLLPFVVIIKLSGGLIIGGLAMISLGYTRLRAMG